MASPYALIDTALKAQLTSWAELVALVPSARITMPAYTSDIRDADRATPQLAPEIRIVPSDAPISQEKSAGRLNEHRLGYEVQVRQGSAKLATLREIQYQVVRAFLMMSKLKDAEGADLAHPLPLHYRDIRVRAVTSFRDDEQENQWRSIIRVDVLAEGDLDIVLGAPQFVSATFFASPRRVEVTFDSEIEAFSDAGDGWTIKDSGSNPLAKSGASAPGGGAVATIFLASGTAASVSYSAASGSVQSTRGIQAVDFTDNPVT